MSGNKNDGLLRVVEELNCCHSMGESSQGGAGSGREYIMKNKEIKNIFK